MTEALWDAILLEERAVGRSGRQLLWSSDIESGLAWANYKTKETTSSDDPLCSTTGPLAVWEPPLSPRKSQSVALCSQTVAHLVWL